MVIRAELRPCHRYDGHDGMGKKIEEPPTASDLKGFGSREWIMSLMRNPARERFHGKNNDRMPAFGAWEILDARTMGVIADGLRGDWVETTSVPGENQ